MKNIQLIKDSYEFIDTYHNPFEDLENELSFLSSNLINTIGDKVQYRVETLIGKIKEQVTERFRNTLMDLIDEKQELESEINSLNGQIDHLDSRLDDANSDIEYYINQLQEK